MPRHTSQKGENMKRISFAMVLLIAVTSGAGAQQPGDPLKGAALAQSVCAQCHAVRSGQMRSPNPMAPSLSNVANWPGMTEMALRAWLQSSHPTMPNIVLDNNETNDVIAYILSLKGRRSTM
jgi:mono/diheme cytochrome c family protein